MPAPATPTRPDDPEAKLRRAAAILALGVASVSTAAVFIRLADAPPLVIAAWRLTLASLIVVPLAAATSREEFMSLARLDLARAVLSGIMLAAHFALWITSLEYTSVASSVVLVTTNPLWVGVAAPVVLGEGVSRRLLAGIGLAFLGGVVIGWGDMGIGRQAIVGDALAVAGALAVAAYFLIGRHLRGRLSLLSYVALVYGTAAAVLFAAAVVSGQPLSGYNQATWSYLVLLAVVPQLVGHSSFNWALQHVSSTFVAGSVLAEPLGSTLLAWWILGEPPPPMTVIGGALILAGLGFAARAELWPGGARGTG